MPAMPASLSDRISSRGVGANGSSSGSASGYGHHSSSSAAAGPSTSKLPAISSSRFPNPLNDDDDDDEEEEGAIREDHESPPSKKHHPQRRSSFNGRLNGTASLLPPSLPMKPPPSVTSTNGKHKERERDRDYDHNRSRKHRHDSRASSRTRSPSPQRHRISRTRPLGGRYSEVLPPPRDPSPTPSALSRKRTRSPSPLHRSSSQRTRYRSPESRDEYDAQRRRDERSRYNDRPTEYDSHRRRDDRPRYSERSPEPRDENNLHRRRDDRTRHNDRSPSPASSSRKPLPHWKQRDEPVVSRWKERDRTRPRDDSPPHRSRDYEADSYRPDKYRPDRERDRERDHRYRERDMERDRDRVRERERDSDRDRDRDRETTRPRDRTRDDADHRWDGQRDRDRERDSHRPRADGRPSDKSSHERRNLDDDDKAHRSRDSTHVQPTAAPSSTPTPAPQANGKSCWAKIATSTPADKPAVVAAPATTPWQTAPPTGPKSLLVPPTGPKAAPHVTTLSSPAPHASSSPPSGTPTGPRASRGLANTGAHAPNGVIPSGPRAFAYHRPAAPAVVAASSSPTTPRTPDSTTASAATTATTATTVSAATDKVAIHADQDVDMTSHAVRPPPPAPPPGPPPTQLSFKHTPLPNELPLDTRGTTWRVTYDPQLEKDKDQVAVKGKEVVREHPSVSAPAPLDPRLSTTARATGTIAPSSTFLHVCKAAKRRARNQIDVPTWKWTKDSTAPRPPPPPRAIAITGLSPLMTSVQLRTHLRAFGRIEEQELKMDPKTGQSLGIFWLRFAHDFEVKEDEEGDGKLVLGAAAPGQRGHECALLAVAEMQGRKIGAGTHDATVIHVELDGDKSQYVKAYRRELARRYSAESQTAKAAKVAAAAAASSAAATAVRTAASSGTSTPQQHAPTPQQHPLSSHAPTPTDRWQARQASNLGVASPSEPPPAVQDPAEPLANIKARLASFGTPYIFVPRPRQGARTTYLLTAHIERHFSNVCNPLAIMYRQDSSRVGWYVAFDGRDGARRAKSALERSRLMTAGYRLTEMEVHDAPALTTERRQILLDSKGSAVNDGASSRRVSAKQQAQDTLVERRITQGWTESELHQAARREIVRQVSEVLLRDTRNRSIGPFVSEWLKPNAKGGIALQDSLRVVAEREEEEERAAAERRSQRERERGGSGSATPTTPQHSRETEENDVDEDGDIKMDVSRGELPSFRKIKRPSALKKPKMEVPPGFEVVDTEVLAKKAAKAKALLASSVKGSKSKKEVAAMSDEEAVAAVAENGDVDAEMLDLVSQKTKSKKASSKKASSAKSNARHRPKIYSSDSSDGEDDVEEAREEESPAPAKSTSKTTKKGRSGKAGKKGVQFALEEDGRGTPASASATPGPDDSVEAQLKAETAVLSKLKMGGKKSGSTKGRGVRSPSPDPYGLGLADDEEDLYYLRLALERLQAGESVTPATVRPDEGDVDDEEEEEEEEDGDEDAPPRFRFTRAHESGCARTEGFYKIPPSQKAVHLPDRNQATIDVASSTNNITLSSARDHRADSRKLVLGIEQHKKDTASDTDILKFNQLRSRKKQLKFAKSPIHDWGLYAMESIPAGDMVIEYVGEVVRQQVADHRERMYEKQGNFSTYLFRVDDDLVVDATHKGNIARLMNHCCVPNCTAKILTLNGQKRIVIFAKERIGRDQELTYDYKLGESGDIPCLCGVEGCRKWL